MPLEEHNTETPVSERNGMQELWRPEGDSRPSAAKPRWTVHLGIFAVMLAFTMPRLLRSFCPTLDVLDTSWAWMLGYSLQHHLQWGDSVVFTYGPLGFLTHSYFYSDHLLWGLSATVRLATWFVFGLGFARILRRLAPDHGPSPGTTGTALPIAIGWIFGACFLDLSTQCAVLGVLLLVLAVAEEDSTAVTVESALAGSLFALGALVKSTALIVSLFALLAYPALWWHAGHRKSTLRRSLAPLLSFSISFCALWLLSSQSFARLPAYFRGTWEIVRGYTAGMSTPPVPFTLSSVQRLSALLILSVFAGVLIRFQVAGRKVRVAQCLLLGGVAFWAWKEGFTLQDPGYFRHPMTFYGTALLIASVGTVLLSREDFRYLRICLYGAYAVALLSSLLGYPLRSLSYRHVVDNYENYLTLISSKSRRAAEQSRQTVAIQRQFHLPEGALKAVGNGSVNVLPWSLMMAQGYGLRLVSSPVIQTYSVYTPYLDRLNARQIWNGGSADKIIYSFTALGFRYPPFDEPYTFRAIRACYRTEYPGAPYAVLAHVACEPSEMAPVDKREEGVFGKWVLVPPHAKYAQIDVRTTMTGKVTNMVYKADFVWILLGLANGQVAGPFQLIYPVANDGIFIRYFIGSQSEAASLFAGNTSGLRRIAGIQIVASSHSSDYAKNFAIRFFDDRPPHQHPLGNAGQP